MDLRATVEKRFALDALLEGSPTLEEALTAVVRRLFVQAGQGNLGAARLLLERLTALPDPDAPQVVVDQRQIQLAGPERSPGAPKTPAQWRDYLKALSGAIQEFDELAAETVDAADAEVVEPE